MAQKWSFLRVHMYEEYRECRLCILLLQPRSGQWIHVPVRKEGRECWHCLSTAQKRSMTMSVYVWRVQRVLILYLCSNCNVCMWCSSNTKCLEASIVHFTAAAFNLICVVLLSELNAWEQHVCPPCRQLWNCLWTISGCEQGVQSLRTSSWLYSAFL